MNSNIIYQNKFCKLYFKDTFIILSSKRQIYNDVYFISFEQSRQYMAKLGITI
jgi:hypothetical protein